MSGQSFSQNMQGRKSHHHMSVTLFAHLLKMGHIMSTHTHKKNGPFCHSGGLHRMGIKPVTTGGEQTLAQNRSLAKAAGLGPPWCSAGFGQLIKSVMLFLSLMVLGEKLWKCGSSTLFCM